MHRGAHRLHGRRRLRTFRRRERCGASLRRGDGGRCSRSDKTLWPWSARYLAPRGGPSALRSRTRSRRPLRSKPASATYVKFGRGFVGEEALAAQRANGLKKHLIGLATDDARTIARQGYPILIDDVASRRRHQRNFRAGAESADRDGICARRRASGDRNQTASRGQQSKSSGHGGCETFLPAERKVTRRIFIL